ncbi:MAG: histidine kinase N-terminal domain-containing protein, partial [Clostridia bacterium]
FIDCLIPSERAALILAHAQPRTVKSLYQSMLGGQIVLAEHEPGVLFCLQTGKPIIESKGTYPNEQVAMQQNIVPIKNDSGKTIAALIMERDISEKVKQDKSVEKLMETTEHLSETLLQIAMSENKVPALIHEGIVLFDERNLISFANARAYELLNELGCQGTIVGKSISLLPLGNFTKEKIMVSGGVICEEVQYGKLIFQVKAVSIYREHKTVGGILLLQDITEIKEKDKQLMIKSAVIKEIHHRVKNNLQTIASLLRLQMRRSPRTEVEKVFRESINRITSISIVHELLAQEGIDSIDCREVLETIARGIVSTSDKSGQTINVSVTGDSLFLQTDKATSLSLIVNELIQNCVNHAFVDRTQGEIEVALHRRNQFVHVVVTDNGVGFDYANRSRKGHLGLEIAETLDREKLEGVVEFSNSGSGTQVTIMFPCGSAEQSG